MKAKQKSSLVNVFMLLPSLVRKGFLYVHRLTKVIKTGGIFGRTGREKKGCFYRDERATCCKYRNHQYNNILLTQSDGTKFMLVHRFRFHYYTKSPLYSCTVPFFLFGFSCCLKCCCWLNNTTTTKQQSSPDRLGSIRRCRRDYTISSIISKEFSFAYD